MTRAKTLAQWRREVPEFDRAVRAVEDLREVWPGRPHMVAHIHPGTRVVSLILHGGESLTATADRYLGGYGYPAGGWSRIPGLDHAAWRKVVAR